MVFETDISPAAKDKDGIRIYVNKSWCTNSTTDDTYSSADQVYPIIRCRSFYLPQEFICNFAVAVYVPLDANPKEAQSQQATGIASR